ncbi:hypothetical protein [Pygmaiobacter massiliensis]|uniref:hypothetical protein n=1 Tax=Pygmaiobacter massiliensis TaxID=1917873 RepID=UPI002A8207B3|nr:hypothetical protein [Pygmaiobacter massiliensis]MDY4783788.1 hypothetical protein [Pygmaiobacter massiliensis]
MLGKGAVPASDMVSKHVSNPIGKAAVNRIAEATGEGVEEVAENLVNPHIQQYIYGKQVNHSEVCSSLGEAFAGGALASLLLGVTGDVKNGIEAKRKNSIPPTQVNTEVSQSAVSDTAFSNPSIADLRENATPLSKENTVRTPSESKPKSESKLEFVRNGISTPSISNSAQNATPASKEVSDNILNQLYNQPGDLGAKTSQLVGDSEVKLEQSDIEKLITAMSRDSGKDIADFLKELDNIPVINGDHVMRIMDIMSEAEKYGVNSRKRVELENQAYKIVADKFNSSAMDNGRPAYFRRASAKQIPLSQR